ncbi:MAG: FAD-dependent monooxygenase [Planctomycetia bacterium]|nr:FAD-dependent monooxygenase [Planctomycetia bacterium]
MSESPPFTIVGAGLAGTLLACYLGRLGYRVELHERRPDPRHHNQDRGRSINLALSVRGLHALREVGLADEVLRSAILMRGRMIHGQAGDLTFQPYGKDDSEALYSVSRAGLNLLLVEAAARLPAVNLYFGQRCTGFDPGSNVLDFQDTGKIAAEIIVGADGAYSAIRAQMQRQEHFNYQQEYLTHGYKELTIPAGPNGAFQLEKHALHIWPRGSFMMIALPNQDGSFTCTLFWPLQGPNSFAALTAPDDIRRFFTQQFPDAVPLLPTLVEDFLHNPTGSLVTIRCRPWHQGGKAVLVGDACHAVVPFLGQGMNAAFEDCTVLTQCLQAHAPHWEAAFRDYEARRKPHLDVLADLCLENFIEMRDRVGSRWFVLKKQLAVALHRLLPRWYLPLYTMIEFTRIPYADALRRARWQDRIVRGVLIGSGLLLLGLLWWQLR